MEITVRTIQDGKIIEQILEGFEATINIKNVKFDLAQEEEQLLIQKESSWHESIIIVPKAENKISIQ